MAVARHFVLGAELPAVKGELVVDRVDDGRGITWLRDPRTGQAWQENWLHSEQHGGGTPYLVRLPVPSSEELIQIAFESESLNESWAASTLLANLPEEFPAVLEAAESHARAGRWDRVGHVIAWTGLDSPANRRPILGKHVSEINSDYQHFVALAGCATQLRRQAETATGKQFRFQYNVPSW